MRITIYTFGARSAISARSSNEGYQAYREVSLTAERVDIARKAFQARQLDWLGRKAGV